MIIRKQVAEEARKLIGIPYDHHGRSIETGIDCAGSIVVVSKALKYFNNNFDYILYRIRPDPDELLREMRDKFDEIPVEQAKEGDIIAFWLPKREGPTHMGFLAKGLYEMMIIHALKDQTTSQVVEEPYRRRKKYVSNVFRFRGVVDE